MTVPDAIATLKLAGAVERSDDRLILRLPKRRPPLVNEALCVLQDRPSEAIGILSPLSASVSPTASLEAVLKGRAVGLCCDSLRQTLWLVADEEDARLLGERRGLVCTADEIRLVASIDDQEFIRDIHAFKNEFNVAAKRDCGSEMLGKSRGNDESTS